jgi:hypothetical protein
MNEEQLRAQFEEWASDEGRWIKAVERYKDSYKLLNTVVQWVAFQACAKIKDAEIAELKAQIENLHNMLE